MGREVEIWERGSRVGMMLLARSKRLGVVWIDSKIWADDEKL